MFDQSANSPDMNTIENMGNCQNKFAEKQPSYTEALREAIKKDWAEEIWVEYNP